jgi:hypothetical protein
MSTPNVDDLLTSLRGNNGRTLPNLKDIAAAIIQTFGGLEDFALEFHSQYTKAKKNPAAASRMLADTLQLMLRAQEETEASGLENMTDEQIKDAIVEAYGGKKHTPAAEAGTPAHEPTPTESSVPA